LSKSIKALTAIISFMIIGAAWGLLLTAEARLQSEQDAIMAVARNFINYGIYDRAAFTINQAMALEGELNPNLMYELAQVHRSARSFNQYRNTLQILLDAASPPQGMSLADLYIELYEHDITTRNIGDVITLLRQGWETTNDIRLFELYEEHRYAFIIRRSLFDEASFIWDNAGLVRQGERWGFVNSRGNIVILPQFDNATNFMGGNAVVIRNEQLEIINRLGMRQAVAGFSAESIANFDGSNFAAQLHEDYGYMMAARRGLEIIVGDDEFDFMGIPSQHIQVAQRDGLWAIRDRGNRETDISSDFTYESIAVDSLGRAAVNYRLFVKENYQYYMIDLAGNQIAGPFDEAQPFFEAGGLAAVAIGGKWGLISASGNMIIDFIYEGARSSGFSFAAVKVDGLWGYITLENYPEPLREQFFGRMVIEPQFLDAKPFVNGCAPVLGHSGWFYIVLVEHN